LQTNPNFFFFTFLMAKKRSLVGFWAMLLAAIAIGAVIYYSMSTRGTKPPVLTTAVVTKGDIIQSVTATGVLQSPTSVDVSSQISGQIKELLVDYNNPVKKGDVLARIDPASYESRLRQAEATLASATANNTLVRLNTQRTRELRTKSLVSQQDVDSAEAQLAQSDAAVLTAKASLDDARVNLERCTITAPIDGIVLDRQCDEGKTVAASLNAPTLFTLVTDLTKMEISADIAEADIGNVVEGQDVTFTVDAYPSRTFRGKILQVRNLPKTSQSVVVYSTIIAVDNSDLKLKPGMTANVSVIVAKRNETLKVANAVLRARIPDAYLLKSPNDPQKGPAAPPAEKSGDNTDRRAQIRQLFQDAGVNFVWGQPLSASDREKIVKLAAERGIELPERLVGASRKGAEPTVVTRTVYRMVSPLPDLKIEAVNAKFGITDGSMTEILEGLSEGDTLVSSMYLPGDTAVSQQPNRNPFGGQSGPPGMPPRR
jgi:HlyD family secretion protein